MLALTSQQLYDSHALLALPRPAPISAEITVANNFVCITQRAVLIVLCSACITRKKIEIIAAFGALVGRKSESNEVFPGVIVVRDHVILERHTHLVQNGAINTCGH